MIRPPGVDGVVFSESSDGDIRNDPVARVRLSATLGLPAEWATVRQAHGGRVVHVDDPGDAGEADAVWTTVPGLPVAVFTADCFGVVLLAQGATGVAHAGWRGAVAGVVRELRSEMTEHGQAPTMAAVGPGIGSCCFEVGSEVSVLFPEDAGETLWGTVSVDLRGSIARHLSEIGLWVSDRCTYHDDGLFSHRKDATAHRLAAVGWLA